MGYTHYWYRKQTEIPVNVMGSIVKDFRDVIPALTNLGIPLAGGLGEGEPEINIDGVWFNGLGNCGHTPRDLGGIPWPSATATGVQPEAPVTGQWYAGGLLQSRTCDGDCSYETFNFPRVLEADDLHLTDDGIFACCKTAYRPYDVAVTAFLIIAKHHLGADIDVSTDGKVKDWKDAEAICAMVLGPITVSFDEENNNLQFVKSANS